MLSLTRVRVRGDSEMINLKSVTGWISLILIMAVVWIYHILITILRDRLPLSDLKIEISILIGLLMLLIILYRVKSSKS